MSSNSLQFIPTSKNFSEFKTQEGEHDEFLEFAVGDDGDFSDKMFSKVQGEELLFKLLQNLDDKEKVILLYHMLKEFGFELTQEQYAETLNFSRVYYTSLARELKLKCAKIIQAVQK